MTIETLGGRTWPRRRLQVRSVISATLPFGWAWAAMTALIPYFLIGHGAGSSAEVVLGATRATWMSLHVWSTMTMGLVTIAHVLLNRKGVARSLRIVTGGPHKSASTRPARRGYVWVGAAVLIALTTAGGYWFASVDDTHPAGDGRDVIATDADTATAGSGSFSGHRGGRR